MNRSLINESKFLAKVLRHQPEIIGLTLDEHGWADIDTLLQCLQSHKRNITREKLDIIVSEDSKKRYTISEDGKKIRAAQGHSIPVDLELVPKDPPPTLYHGTAERFLNSIMRDGLQPRSRNYVHLSTDINTATIVGKRHGKPAILELDVASMVKDGKQFYLAENNVWLTNPVEPKYLNRIQ